MSVRLDDAIGLVNTNWQEYPKSLIINDKKLINKYPELDIIEKVRGTQREIYFDKRVKKLLENVTYTSHNRKYSLLNEHHFRAMLHINMHCDPSRITINGLTKVKGGRIYMRQNLLGMARRMKMSVSGAKQSLRLLKEAGLILVAQLDPDSTNHTNYYTINYEKLYELIAVQFAQLYPNIPTPETFVDKSSNMILDETKVVSHIESNINENKLYKKNSEEEEPIVDKIPVEQNPYAPKTNFFGKVTRFLYNKFDKYSSNMRPNKYIKSSRPEFAKEQTDYFGTKFKNKTVTSMEEERYIHEKFHTDEAALCQILRHKLKEHLGKPVYVSWFNDVDLTHNTADSRSELIVEVKSNFVSDYIKNNYLQTLQRIAGNLAIKEVRLAIRPSPNQPETLVSEAKTSIDVENIKKPRKPYQRTAKPN